MNYDDNILNAIDQEMGWEDVTLTRKKLGVHCKFIEKDKHPFWSAQAWVGSDKVWSVTVLNRNKIACTLLAKSFKAVSNLFFKLCERSEENKADYWNRYYSKMWERKYKKWVCKNSNRCDCQLCRMGFLLESAK